MNKNRWLLLSGVAAVSAGVALTPGVAEADVSWEHSGSITVSTMKQPVARLKMYTNYAPDRARMLMYYAAPMVPATPVPAEAFQGSWVPPELRPKKITGYGSFGLVQRMDDDRLIAYESQTGAYMNESRSLVMRKMTVDPWKKIAPELSQSPTPELSEAQRARLGAEVRAGLSPIMKRFSKSYFRQLDEKRTIQGLDGTGYRLTQLINIGGIKKSQQQWMKMSFEWWMAGEQPGDEIIKSLQEKVGKELVAINWPSTSMWRNEFSYILLYSLPEAYSQALKTVAPGPSFSQPSFGGTPLSFEATVTPPPLQRAMMGDVKMTMLLTKRDNEALPARVFEAPEKYKRLNMAPYFKKLDEMREKATIDEIFKELEK
ncbi:MAG TPA: hypothetical protein VF719_02915 [Abditibacteriaceae bacterium]